MAADAGQPARLRGRPLPGRAARQHPVGAQHAGQRRRPPGPAAARSRSSPPPRSPEAERPPLLRAYLEKWKWEVGAFFDGVGPDSSDEELRRIAPDHPAFRID